MNAKMLMTVLTSAILLVLSIRAFSEDSREDENVGAVYAMTNSSSGNAVVGFNRDDDGMLTVAGSVLTGGLGSGTILDPLGSQGSLMLSENQKWLLAVNAGSSEISVFRVMPDSLKLTDKINSGGVFPVSVAIFHNLVYVLNAGGSPNITGFRLDHRGELTPLWNSARSLGAGGFAQVGFSPQGERLVITDKTNNRILVYSLNHYDVPGMNPVISPSNGVTPFGLFFDRWERLFVVEAGTNAVSSYRIMPNGILDVLNGSVPNGQTAACWITGNERGEIFTANPGSGTISAYWGKFRNLVLLNPVAGTGNKPIDISITRDGNFLYALDPANGTVDMFKIGRHGDLTNLGVIAGGFSIFAQGIAAR